MNPNGVCKPFRAGNVVRVVEIGDDVLRSKRFTVVGLLDGSPERDLITPQGWWQVVDPDTGRILEFQRDVLRRVLNEEATVVKPNSGQSYQTWDPPSALPVSL